jgi:hypothetical protein
MSSLPLMSEPDSIAEQRVVVVGFEAADGARWSAIGGGASLEEAIAFARSSTPSGRYWRVVRIQDVYE